MTFKDAQKLRARILASGLYCTVPTGFGPDGYFARIITSREPAGSRDFYSDKEWVAWRVGSLRDDIRRRRELAKPVKMRSPLDIMIDRACGIGVSDK